MLEDVNKKEKNINEIDIETKEERIMVRDLILGAIDCGDVKDRNFCVNVATRWLDEHEDGCYLGCYVNKIGDVVVALYSRNTIYLLGEAYRTIMYAPKLMFHVVASDHIHIDDVLVKHNGVGNGSAVMAALLLYAKQNGIKKITGFLSSVDDDHQNRRDGYYEKFGFKIGNGQIIKEL